MVVSANTNICPRCRGRINTFREYAECVTCGYVDYERECEYPQIPRPETFRADVWVLPYKGKGEDLQDMRLIVDKVFSKDWSPGLEIKPRCPFCDMSMDKHKRSHVTYSCEQNHGVVIVVREKEIIGWKLPYER
jgi:hypothetical protein